MIEKIKETIKFLRNFTGEMSKNHISAHASSIAFFFFLSLVPMLIVVCTIIPYTPLTRDNMIQAVTDLTPDKIDPLAESLIIEVFEKSASILWIAAIITLWSAGKGVLALMRGLNAIHHVHEKRNYIWVRMVASFYTIIMLGIMIISLFVMVFGNRLVELILYKMPALREFVSALMNLRFVVVWLLLIFFFALIYTFVPNKKQKIKEQYPGALFSAIVWSVFSWGFSLYVDLNDFTVYGSLAIIIIIMLWMYFCMYIILMGAYLNNYLLSRNLERTSL